MSQEQPKPVPRYAMTEASQLCHVADSIEKVADTIHNRTEGTADRDASGNRVCSLTDAIIGMTAGLFAIAKSIDNLADAVRMDEE